MSMCKSRTLNLSMKNMTHHVEDREGEENEDAEEAGVGQGDYQAELDKVER